MSRRLGVSRFVLNRHGLFELMRSSAMQEVLEDHAQAVARRVGSGYKTDTYVGKTRANAQVAAETSQAYRDCLENNTLVKALSGGGGGEA